MRPEGILLRQIHPDWVQENRPTSQAFRPSPKDVDLLSVYDGDQIQPEAAWQHWTEVLQLSSAGVCGVSVAECGALDLPCRPDPEPFPEHAVIDFTGVGGKEAVRRAKKLSHWAVSRGWLFQPDLA